MFCLHSHMWTHRNKSQSLHIKPAVAASWWLPPRNVIGWSWQKRNFHADSVLWLWVNLWRRPSLRGLILLFMQLKLNYNQSTSVLWEIERPPPPFSWFPHNVSAAVTFTTCPVVPLTHFNMYLYKSHWPSVRWTFYFFINLLFYNIWTESDSHSLAL